MKLHTVIKQSKHWTNISQTVLEMSTNNDCYEAPENCKCNIKEHNQMRSHMSHNNSQVAWQKLSKTHIIDKQTR